MALFRVRSPQFSYSFAFTDGLSFLNEATKIARVRKDVVMSRIDIFGDRVCVVTSLLIMGWFIYNVAF
ncbi:hypothetical protein [Sphingobium sp.]|uniref:hypothetical protein n=1 Tax=Sphingobium sp. TaxID=1912891 RepID=UPI0028BD7E25|nr:hypothetical protein [Sphingobium sp.]